jgi:hypothetical protein
MKAQQVCEISCARIGIDARVRIAKAIRLALRDIPSRRAIRTLERRAWREDPEAREAAFRKFLGEIRR